jgi:hypothetical protein
MSTVIADNNGMHQQAKLALCVRIHAVIAAIIYSLMETNTAWYNRVDPAYSRVMQYSSTLTCSCIAQVYVCADPASCAPPPNTQTPVLNQTSTANAAQPVSSCHNNQQQHTCLHVCMQCLVLLLSKKPA